MAKLVLEIEYDYDFVLIGVSCHEKEYRLSWALNNSLNLELAKAKDLSLDTKKQKEPALHSLYQYENESQYRQYFLITNKGTQGFLVPEQKHADYFLMIKGALLNDDQLSILKKIKETQMVLTAFYLDPTQLKSRENLLF